MFEVKNDCIINEFDELANSYKVNKYHVINNLGYRKANYYAINEKLNYFSKKIRDIIALSKNKELDRKYKDVYFEIQNTLLVTTMIHKKFMYSNVVEFVNIKSILSLIEEKFETVDDNLLEIISLLKLIQNKFKKSIDDLDEIDINSDEYYKNTINNLEEEKRKLKDDIERLKENDINYKTDLIIKEEKLNEYQALIDHYKDVEQNNKKESDSLNQWESRINESFKVLNDERYLSKEYTKLKVLFYVYCGLAFGIFVFLAYVECRISNIIFKNIANENFSYKEYLNLIVPIPIAVAFVWGFIYQANRAQRQSVVIAKNIHDIKYIEAILKAVNRLSTNKSLKEERIHNALDKLFDNHLSRDNSLDEIALKQEEGKDVIPTDKLISIIKEIVTK